MKRLYDESDASSILAYAKKLTGKSLAKLIGMDQLKKMLPGGKGGLGILVEKAYFGITPPNTAEPDFPKAGIELKTNPLVRRHDGFFGIKERLVLGVIDYHALAKEEWQSSTFLRKNQKLLLLFYVWEKDVHPGHLIFDLVDLWEFPEADLRIIEQDWHVIQQKVKAGKAEQLSEGDTFLLAASTKGANKESTRSQAGGGPDAMQRALSFKPRYMLTVYERLAGIRDPDAESLFGDRGSWSAQRTFEEAIYQKFKPYIGMKFDKIAKEFGLSKLKGKARFEGVSRAILGVKKRKIQEFEDAEVVMRTIRTDKNGRPAEALSLKAFKFDELLKEKWEDSPFQDWLTKKFFFVIYQKEGEELVLRKAMFWNMPYEDREKTAKDVWAQARRAVKQSDSSLFPKMSENRVAHVRPHGTNKADTDRFPNGSRSTKRSFWLNQGYIKDVIGIA